MTHDFPDRLRAARERAGRTRTDVGSAIHRSERQIIRYERGQAKAPRSVVVTLARMLNAPELLEADQ